MSRKSSSFQKSFTFSNFIKRETKLFLFVLFNFVTPLFAMQSTVHPDAISRSKKSIFSCNILTMHILPASPAATLPGGRRCDMCMWGCGGRGRGSAGTGGHTSAASTCPACSRTACWPPAAPPTQTRPGHRSQLRERWDSGSDVATNYWNKTNLKLHILPWYP